MLDLEQVETRVQAVEAELSVLERIEMPRVTFCFGSGHSGLTVTLDSRSTLFFPDIEGRRSKITGSANSFIRISAHFILTVSEFLVEDATNATAGLPSNCLQLSVSAQPELLLTYGQSFESELLASSPQYDSCRN